jgi:hypothetical protein
MNDAFQDLEAELKRLRPRAPSPSLLARIERELAPVSSPRPLRAGFWGNIWWPMAAALLMMSGIVTVLLVRVRRDAPSMAIGQVSPVVGSVASNPPVVPAFKPVRVSNVFYASRVEGLVTLADGTPARRVRDQYVDTYTWRNPRTHAFVQWTVPREELRVVPVSAY